MEVSGRSQTDSEDFQAGLECDYCLFDRTTVTAEWFCTDCIEFMCDKCARTHRSSRISRDHKLLDRDEMPRQKLKILKEKLCTNHANKQIEFFCKRHDQLCCSACVTVDHRLCGVLYIEQPASVFSTSQEYQDLLKEIKLLDTELSETKRQSEKNCEDVNQFFTALISDIRHFRLEINTKLDELERKVIEEAQKIKTDDLSSMESISTQSETIQKQLREISSTLENLEKYKQNQQLFISSKQHLADVVQLRQEMEELSLKNHIKTYSVECSEDIVNSINTCCRLKIFDSQPIIHKDPKQIKAKFMKNINIQHKQDSSSYCDITGSSLLTFDSLALTDRKNCSVKLVDLHTDTITSCLQLAYQPQDLTCMDSNTLVVTCGTHLTFLKFDEKLSILKQIPMEDGCHGIKSHQSKLFVTFIGKPLVKILNNKGAALHTIKINSQEQNLLGEPRYIALSTDGQTIYVSNWEQNTVISYCVTGEELNVYKHKDLKWPRGLTVIENKFILVCGYKSLSLISSLCEHIQIVLESNDVGVCPCTVLYNRRNNMIYISCGGSRNNFVSVFQLE